MQTTGLPLEFWKASTMALVSLLPILIGLIAFWLKKYIDDQKEERKDNKSYIDEKFEKLTDAFFELKELVIRHDADISILKGKRTR